MVGFWTPVANLRRPDMKDGWSQTPALSSGGAGGVGGGVKIIDITDDSFLPPQTWQFPEVGEEELQEIIRKLEDRFLPR